MPDNVAFLAGLLDEPDPVGVSREDFAGEHGSAVRGWQRLGFVSDTPSAHPAPSCPHCGEGVPHPARSRYLCDRCGSTVDRSELLLWTLDRRAFLRWLAAALHLRGEPRPVDASLWQLGTWGQAGDLCEVFYRRPVPLSEAGGARLLAYRCALVLFGRSPPPPPAGFRGRTLSLLEVLTGTPSLTASDLGDMFRPRGNVRFDAHSGALWVGDAWLGEAPVGSKEYFFLARLAADLDRFVPYADLKREVLRQSASLDGTEEATFCQKLKSRVKARYVPRIDRLLATTNKADGYRLRGFCDLSDD